MSGSSPTRPLTIDDFQKGIRLGQGAVGEVFMARNRLTEQLVAIKCVYKAQAVRKHKMEHVNRERDALVRVEHPFIVSLLGTFQDSHRLYFVLSLCTGGSLLQRVASSGPLCINAALLYTAEVCSAVEYLHGQQLVHKDVHPSNVLLCANGHVRIADFGTCEALGDPPVTHAFTGSPHIMCHELVTLGQCSYEADWWAVGVTLFHLLTGRWPFDGATTYDIWERIKLQQAHMPLNFPEHIASALSQWLRPDPRHRMGHPRDHIAFAGVRWESLEEEDVPKADEAPEHTYDFPPLPELEEDDCHDLYGDRRRQVKLQKQKKGIWAPFLLPNELIVESGLVLRRKGLFTQKRQLILTDYPRLFLIDPDKMTKKGDLQWDADLSVDIKSNRSFVLNSGGRSMLFEETNPHRWAKQIQAQQRAGAQ